MAFQCFHVLGTQAFLWVQHYKLVYQVPAGWLYLHRCWPLDLTVVNLREHRVVLRACEGHLASDHFKDYAAECP